MEETQISRGRGMGQRGPHRYEADPRYFNQLDMAFRQPYLNMLSFGILRPLVVSFLLSSSILFTRAGSERVVVCENDGVTIECNPGSYLDIRRADYASPAPEKCLHRSARPGPPNNHRSTHCQQPNTLPLLKVLCQNREKCHVRATNNVFGDPCRGIPKFLEFVYICTEDSKENEADVP